MEESRWDVSFPQANDFDKIIRILNVDDAERLGDKKYLSLQLDMITDRQVQYYVSACAYLGLISKEKRFTTIANELREMNSSEQTIEMARLIVSNEVFGTAYFTQKMFDVKLTTDDIIELMKTKGVVFESDEMYKRRAQTVTGWLGWIEREMG